jgi:hypothetical protein
VPVLWQAWRMTMPLLALACHPGLCGFVRTGDEHGRSKTEGWCSWRREPTPISAACHPDNLALRDEYSQKLSSRVSQLQHDPVHRSIRGTVQTLRCHTSIGQLSEVLQGSPRQITVIVRVAKDALVSESVVALVYLRAYFVYLVPEDGSRWRVGIACWKSSVK